MIIVEGFDNSGKTTLIRSLSEKMQLPIQLSTGPITDEGLRDYLDRFIRDDEVKLYDRTPLISEAIYRPIRRPGTFVADQAWLLAMLMRMTPVIVYCRPPNEKIFNFGEREQMAGVIDNAKRILASYDLVMSALLKVFHWPVIYYDYTKTPTDTCIEWIDKQLVRGEVLRNRVRQFQTLFDDLRTGVKP
jgi:hypothetical protein